MTALFDTSYGQKPKVKKSKENVTTKTVDSKQKSLQDTAFLNQYVRLYADSILTIVDSLSKDTNFLKSIGDTSIFGYGEFAKSEYKIRFPARPLGWTSDFENIFTTDQINELDSTISNFEKETYLLSLVLVGLHTTSRALCRLGISIPSADNRC